MERTRHSKQPVNSSAFKKNHFSDGNRVTQHIKSGKRLSGKAYTGRKVTVPKAPRQRNVGWNVGINNRPLNPIRRVTNPFIVTTAVNYITMLLLRMLAADALQGTTRLNMHLDSLVLRIRQDSLLLSPRDLFIVYNQKGH